jgi:hypothetical protein
MEHVLQLLPTIWHAFQAITPWLVVSLIPSLIVGLTPYPKAAEAVAVLKTILNFLSVLTHSDSPGTFKAPFTMSPPPTGMPPDATSGPTTGAASPVASMGPPVAAGAALAVLFAMAMIPGCGASAAQWKATGIDEAKCAAPAIAGALLDGLIDLLDDASANESPDYQKIGEQLAQKYGPRTALCAVRVAWQHLGDPPTPDAGAPAQTLLGRASTGSARSRRLAALDWLVHHERAWATAPSRR